MILMVAAVDTFEESMSLSTEQLHMASQIDTRVCELERVGADKAMALR